jgi:hypothetical protein
VPAPGNGPAILRPQTADVRDFLPTQCHASFQPKVKIKRNLLRDAETFEANWWDVCSPVFSVLDGKHSRFYFIFFIRVHRAFPRFWQGEKAPTFGRARSIVGSAKCELFAIQAIRRSHAEQNRAARHHQGLARRRTRPQWRRSSASGRAQRAIAVAPETAILRGCPIAMARLAGRSFKLETPSAWTSISEAESCNRHGGFSRGEWRPDCRGSRTGRGIGRGALLTNGGNRVQVRWSDRKEGNRIQVLASLWRACSTNSTEPPVDRFPIFPHWCKSWPELAMPR